MLKVYHRRELELWETDRKMKLFASEMLSMSILTRGRGCAEKPGFEPRQARDSSRGPLHHFIVQIFL